MIGKSTETIAQAIARSHAEATAANGWLVIQDLGDDTLANWLLRNPGDKPALGRCFHQYHADQCVPQLRTA